MSKNPIRDKLLAVKDKDKDKPGIEQLKNAAIKAIKGILAAIKKNYEIEMHITCIIAGVGTVSTFEFLKSEIEVEEEEEETESTKKIVELLKKKIEKARDRIVKAIMAKNLTILTFTATTESIPYISWISNVAIEVTIKLVE